MKIAAVQAVCLYVWVEPCDIPLCNSDCSSCWQISKALEVRGSGPLKDVRLIRDKATGKICFVSGCSCKLRKERTAANIPACPTAAAGLSRGFAFVEFLTLKDSIRVVDLCSVSVPGTAKKGTVDFVLVTCCCQMLPL